MTQVKAGDTVRIHYTGTLNDGTQFDSSEGRDPLQFEVGAGQIIPGLDKALPGMAVGEKKTVHIPASEAYGDVNPQMQQAIPRAQFPPEIEVQPGTRLQMQSPDGQAIPVTVTDVTDQHVMLDANHPLAGQDLNFDFEIVSIN